MNWFKTKICSVPQSAKDSAVDEEVPQTENDVPEHERWISNIVKLMIKFLDEDRSQDAVNMTGSLLKYLRDLGKKPIQSSWPDSVYIAEARNALGGYEKSGHDLNNKLQIMFAKIDNELGSN